MPLILQEKSRLGFFDLLGIFFTGVGQRLKTPTRREEDLLRERIPEECHRTELVFPDSLKKEKNLSFKKSP